MAATADRLGRYALVAELAPGAFGPLWAARVASGAEEGRLVVVRRIAVPSGDAALVQRLSEAAFAAMEVRNAKIAAVLDVVVAEREVSVVSEYVDAQTLRSLQRIAAVKRLPFPPAVALRIAMDLLQALRAAREAWTGQALEEGFHGGVTPDSVLLATFGDVMLADLGVSAVIVRTDVSRDDPGVVAYRAPEQIGSTAPVDERADVFTIGVLLWELIVNRPLFGFPGRLRERDGPRVGASGAAEEVCTKPIPALDEVEREGAPVPRAVVEIVKHALERDPNHRFQSVEQMLGHILAQARGAAATPEQVAMVVDRLARSQIDAQRASLASLGGIDDSERPSAPPGSGRPTKRPPAPDAHAQLVVDFSKHEAPTTSPAFSPHDVPTPPIPDQKDPLPRKRSLPPAPPRRTPGRQPPNAMPVQPIAPIGLMQPIPPAPMAPIPPAPVPSTRPMLAVEPAQSAPIPPPPMLSSAVVDSFPGDAAVYDFQAAPSVVDGFRAASPGPRISERRRRARQIAIVVFAGVGILLLLVAVRALFSGSEPDGATPPVKSAAAREPPRPGRSLEPVRPSESSRPAVPPVATETSPPPAPSTRPEAPNAPGKGERPRERSNERRKDGYRPRGI